MNRRAFLSTSVLAAAGIPRALPAVRPRLRPDLTILLEVTKVPGFAVAGVLDGTTIEMTAGVRSSSAPAAITADTQFPAASLSKPVFAWAVRDLVRAGKLDWDKPLADYADLGLSGEAKRITAAHALTHSSGLPNWRFQAGQALSAEFPPGSRWQYSGEGVVLLQRVVEKIVAVPIATYMKDRVLVPMGMTASTFAWTPEIEAKAAAGHDRNGAAAERSLHYYARQNYEVLDKAGLRPESATFEQIVDAYEKAKLPPLPVTISPNMAGSLQTTVTDYAKFLQRVRADAASHPDDFRPRIDVNRQIAWTLGWGIDRSLERPSVFHWGDGPGFKNFAWVQLERKTALVFLTNGDHGASLYAWVFREIVRRDPAAFYWI